MSALPDPVPANAAGLADVRTYLRVDGADDDALLARLLAAATAVCEEFTGQVLIARDAREVVRACPEWRRLGLTPVTAITAVEAYPVDGAAAVLPVDGYAVDIDAAGDGWVRATGTATTRLRVTYRSGLAEDWTGLPEAIRQGVVRLAAHFYSCRDAAGEGAPPAAVAALWRPWRRMRLR